MISSLIRILGPRSSQKLKDVRCRARFATTSRKRERLVPSEMHAVMLVNSALSTRPQGPCAFGGMPLLGANLSLHWLFLAVQQIMVCPARVCVHQPKQESITDGSTLPTPNLDRFWNQLDPNLGELGRQNAAKLTKSH